MDVFWQQVISGRAAIKINDKAIDRMMPEMLNLADVFQYIVTTCVQCFHRTTIVN